MVAQLKTCSAAYAAALQGPQDAHELLKQLEGLCEGIEYEVDTNDPQYRRWKLPQQVPVCRLCA